VLGAGYVCTSGRCQGGTATSRRRGRESSRSRKRIASDCLGFVRRPPSGVTEPYHLRALEAPWPVSATTPLGSIPSRARTKEKTGTPRAENCCSRLRDNARKVRKIVKLLRVDRSLKVERFGTKQAARPPPAVACGTLRSTVRNLFAPRLSPVEELSIKTAAKAESNPCGFCEDQMQKTYISNWKRERQVLPDVDAVHLAKFRKAIRSNIPLGWDNRRTPYVPNGHATAGHGRSKGGNWNDEEFSPLCEPKLIFSSGKPRVVTLFSSENVAVLTPLHHSLYNRLRGRDWLLVGSPTPGRLSASLGSGSAEWISVDYESATDRIKTAYVEAAVEELIARAENLSPEEIACLRVLSCLVLDGTTSGSGQPMGSPMSFPLLCLINKTVVDLALGKMLEEGEIPLQEYSGHRCLINGDDLLTRATSAGDFASAIASEGSQVGLRLNRDKTLVSTRFAEINSTCFRVDGPVIKVLKKTNVSAFWMSARVADVIDFATESTTSAKGFALVVRRNVSRLARQKIKTYKALAPWQKRVLLTDHHVRRALCSAPAFDVPDTRNLFPVVAQPGDFELSHEQVAAAITSEVIRLKQSAAWVGLAQETKQRKKRLASVPIVESARSSWLMAMRALKRNKPVAEKRTLRCLADYWQNLRKEELRAGVGEIPSPPGTVLFDGESCSPFTQIRLALNKWKDNTACDKPLGSSEPPPPPWGDYVLCAG